MRILLDLKSKNYHPDIIIAHPGWGETLYAKDVFPAAKLVHFCEYYYHSKGADAGFDPEFPINDDGVARIRSRNALHLLNLENCDVGVTPTHWQHSLHPAAYQPKIQVIHEGINTDLLGPDPSAVLVLPCGKVIKAGDRVITYVARNLEPYRGFHTFMRSLPKILREDERCEIVIVGGDGVSYGASPMDARSWREKMLRENAIDAKRVHFLGRVSYSDYIRVLQVSAVHVYLTYPFVLSWSFLEAMACGCTIVGSDTPPVTEVLTEENGVIVNFFDINGLAVKISEMLSERKTTSLKLNAMETAKAFSAAAGVVGYSAIIES